MENENPVRSNALPRYVEVEGRALLLIIFNTRATSDKWVAL